MSTTSADSRSAGTRRELKAALDELTLRDAHRLRRRLDKARSPQALAAVAGEIDTARVRLAARRASVPAIEYPPALPVSLRRDDIATAIAEHQVVIVAGETGSGKTTQIPKICLELGRGVRGTIGHTQPRRLAARTVAERIAEELHTELGDVVGYTVRFTDRASENTLVKLMTDGILLAEIQRDRLLHAYDTIIIDEAHERSLNIDFLLGYLRELLPRRPDLKVIVTSATIDPDLFARHFATRDGTPAPIVEVSGRSYPVEVRYQPLTIEVDDEMGEGRTIDRDPVDAVGEAVLELSTENAVGDGDILVFLSGEREIRDTADALRELKLARTEIVPLYARLSAAEQHRVFTPHTGRRVVLSTNVAETSLTVPGIRYVVDPGTARISRYSVRTKVQRLPIEPISQASARQRAGRCGRVSEGICIRLYSEEDFESRPAFTEPEILRTNLAAVILQMAALGLGDVEHFPFLEAPDQRSIRDGLALLDELGAITGHPTSSAPTLTPTGRELAQLPLDPRMARMLAEAHRCGCLAEALIIVSALSIQDVRERPVEQQQAADTSHSRFNVEGSDFLAYLQLWNYLRERRDELSSNQFRRMCKSEFLHWLRIREWQDLHGQLRTITRGLGWNTNESPANENVVHRALLSGLLSHIGVLDERDKDPGSKQRGAREYLGARGTRFAIFPGSSLARKPPRAVMAAELVETSRLWARTVARIDVEWAEKLALHLVKRTYSEPHWSARRGAAMAYEKVTLYGVTLVARRLVPFGTIDAEVARELFIRHALVQGEWQTNHRFFHRNRELLADVEELEHRARRRDIVVDEQALFDFYDERLPADVVSTRHFDNWWRKTRRNSPDLLDFTVATLVNDDAAAVLGGDYPDAWRQGELQFPLSYQFEPGADDDGVTVRIPVAQLALVRPVGFDWLVPGMRLELVTAQIKTLPKQLRRSVVPAPDFARAALAEMTPRSEPLRTALARRLSQLAGVSIAPHDLDPADHTALPDHLRMTFAAVAADGKVIATDKNLDALKSALAQESSAAVAAATAEAQRPAATAWTSETLGTLEPTVTHRVGGQAVTGYPALVTENGGVAVRVLRTEGEQATAMRTGLRELVLHAAPTAVKAVTAGLPPTARLALSQSPYPSVDALVTDARAAAVDEFVVASPPIRTPENFEALMSRVRPRLAARAAELVREVIPILERTTAILARLDGASGPAVPTDIADDIREQLDNLVFDGFVCDLGAARLRELPRYLEAVLVRLDALPSGAARDRSVMAVLDRVYAAYDRLLTSLPEPRRGQPSVVAISWLIEELRVSLFAQQLGTPMPVSEKRIERAIAAAGR
ncbi:MAG TPA: ATP-dependent RNA helicase HrpA [Aldersonia sp.]